MKTYKLSVLICISLALTACKKDKNQSNPISNQTLIVGNWKSTSIAEKDYEDGKITFSDSVSYPLVQFIKFDKDNTGSRSNDVSTYEAFKYSVSGSNLNLTNDTVTNSNPKYALENRTYVIIKVDATTLGLFYDYIVSPAKHFTQTTYYTKQ